MSTKDRVLETLELNKGDFFSGEKLASELGVSRNSVWKAIKDLKTKGYDIESVTNKGYRLKVDSDVISKQGISKFVKNKADIDKLEIYNSISSTNQAAKKQIVMTSIEGDSSEELHGTVIIARSQTAGVGHNNSEFYSPEGGIYLSIILSPEKIRMNRIFQYTAVVVAEAIDKAIADSGLHNTTEIRWINNIYINKKKVCGILTESISDLETGSISNCILGIGIRLDDIKVDRNLLIAEIINKLFHPEDYSMEELTKKYNCRLMDVGCKVSFIIPGEDGKPIKFKAKVIGLNESGYLEVEDDNGLHKVLKQGRIDCKNEE